MLAHLATEAIGTSDIGASSVRRGAPAVWALIVINLMMFGVEIPWAGRRTMRTLDWLGALDPDAVIVRHEYWRLLTALFLHYGLLHILINLYALYLLGPELERLIGCFKFIMGYLIAGLGWSVGGHYFALGSQSCRSTRWCFRLHHGRYRRFRRFAVAPSA